jgi:uncharacterized protein YjbI with pentapeptide repeats
MSIRPSPLVPIPLDAPVRRLLAPPSPPRPLGEALLGAEAPRQLDLLRAARALGALQLPRADLRQIDFRALIAQGLPADVLVGANLSGATLSGARLAGLSLRNAQLDGALLVATDLANSDLSSASLRGAHLTGACLARAELSFCDLRGASLLTADLAHVTATGVDMRDTLLHSARLAHAVLRGADLRWSRLDGANLMRADLRGARFAGASLELANLTAARLSTTTDFGYAFLHRARWDQVALTRAHLGGGVGECFTDLAQARDTYAELKRHFEAEGRADDARWAHRLASRMDTLTHRPDRARTYYSADWSPPHPPSIPPRHPLAFPATTARLRDACRPKDLRATYRHGGLWALGQLNRTTTDYGTSYRRILSTLAVVWLAFGAFFQLVGGLAHLERSSSARWFDGLHYSAAALTPIDAYPLVTTSTVAHLAAIAEGVTGIVLIGALGFVTACRLKRQ